MKKKQKNISCDGCLTPSSRKSGLGLPHLLSLTCNYWVI